MSSKLRLGDLDYRQDSFDDDDYIPGEQPLRHKTKTKNKRRKPEGDNYAAQRANKRRSQENYDYG
ncbi:hypothetical protein [Neptuniibacter halophilus]|uniref:hypothetical protein n=1 Tax=Neptuniibacter halophilus TaxID=651666 RepID=UPI0025744A4D|nr:hypothetical protein [Neptuniibacter halophilus]